MTQVTEKAIKMKQLTEKAIKMTQVTVNTIRHDTSNFKSNYT